MIIGTTGDSHIIRNIGETSILYMDLALPVSFLIFIEATG